MNLRAALRRGSTWYACNAFLFVAYGVVSLYARDAAGAVIALVALLTNAHSLYADWRAERHRLAALELVNGMIVDGRKLQDATREELAIMARGLGLR